jgi:hypothetical protein
MTDNEFLEQYVQSYRMISKSASGDMVYIKDLDLKYRFISPDALTFFGEKAENDVVGLTSKEALDKYNLWNNEVVEQFQRQDLHILKTRKNGLYLDVLPFNNNQVKAFVVRKVPIINPDTDNCVGIRGSFQRLAVPHPAKTLFKIHGVKGLLLSQPRRKDPFQDYPLNSMQHMVLFFCINNYSYSEIAVLMNAFGYEITALKVNEYLEQLKFIFHVPTKNQLIEKAIGLNFNVLYPAGLFNKASSVDINGDIVDVVTL